MTNSGSAILSTEHMTKAYAGTRALDAVDFTAFRGKVNALIGENGAGKSTLMKILAGIETPDAGRIFLEGEEVRFSSARDAAAHGIGIIHQELSLCPNLSVTDNIFLAREIAWRGAVLDRAAQERRTKALLARLDQDIDPRALAGELRIGQQQIVEIARALGQDLRILIMDEPTSALSAAETAALFRVIRELRTQGVTIIYISHRLEELLEIGDHVTVLRDGRLVASAPAESVNVPWIVEKMLGRSLGEAAPHRTAAVRGSELLTVEDLTLPRPGRAASPESVSFSLSSGEILGIYGLMGAGRTEVLECLAGLHPEARGVVRLDGKRIDSHPVARRIREGVILIPEDRQALGIVQSLSIRDNVVLASLGRFAAGFWLSEHKQQVRVADIMGELSIKSPDARALVTSLSGGNQQKVVIARCLLTTPKVLLMDEPTRGIDVAAKAEICDIVKRLAARGLAVIFVSSELKEILAIADRILVMAGGRITGEFDRSAASEQALVEASWPARQVQGEAGAHA